MGAEGAKGAASFCIPCPLDNPWGRGGRRGYYFLFYVVPLRIHGAEGAEGAQLLSHALLTIHGAMEAKGAKGAITSYVSLSPLQSMGQKGQKGLFLIVTSSPLENPWGRGGRRGTNAI